MMPIGVPMKRCTKCGTEYPATTDFFDTNKAGKFGLHSKCKPCRSQKGREWRENNRERHAENGKRWQQNNPDKVAAKTRQYRRRHPEIVTAKYQFRKEHPEVGREAQRLYRLRHPDKKDIRTPEQTRARYHRRRAKKLQAGGNFTCEDIQHKYDAQEGRCWWCDWELNNVFHADHIIPLSRGGSNAPENIVLSCPLCNCSKGSKLPYEWHGRFC